MVDFPRRPLVPSIKSGRIKLATSGRNAPGGNPNSRFRADLTERDRNHGVFAPTGTPEAIIARLNTEIVKIVKTEDMQNRLRTFGLTPTGTSAEYLSTQLAADFAYSGASSCASSTSRLE